MRTINFAINRAGLEGIEDKTDKQVIIEWVKAAYSTAASADPFLHMLWSRVFSKLEAATDSVDLNDMEFQMLRLGLLRANISGAGCNMYVQLLEKFGEVLCNDPTGIDSL